MKQLIIGLVLAVLLVGCSEKPKFSINESDTLETYANNPIFTKIKVSTTVDGKEEKSDKEEKFGYQFTTAPVSVTGIETEDLNVLGGTIVPSSGGQKAITITLTMKGKESFDRLEKRINESKEFTCVKIDVGSSRTLHCQAQQQRGRVIMTAGYNSFSDIASFMYLQQ